MSVVARSEAEGRLVSCRPTVKMKLTDVQPKVIGD